MNPMRPCLFLLLILLASGCAESPEEGRTAVTYRLKWLYNASTTGDLYASVHSHFERRGLSVTLKEGGPERDAVKELELGHAEFGVASADQVIRAVSKGAPVVVIAQLFQSNPLQWIYRSSAVTLRSPADLRGKTIGITYGANDETIMRALLAKHGIEESEVRFRSVHYDPTPFYRGEADLWPVYRNSQGITIEEKMTSAGEAVNYLNPGDHGIRFVANSVVTTRKMTTDHPEVVDKFREALVSAWNDSMDPANSGKSVDTVARFDKDTPKDSIKAQLDVTRMMVKPRPGEDVGMIDLGAWKQTETIMAEQKLIDQRIDVEKILLFRNGGS